MNELARRYAQALYDLAPDEKALRAAAGALMGDGALWEALCSPAIQPWEKDKVLARLPLWEGQKTLQGFFRLLAQRGRMPLLPDILEAFHRMALARRGAALCRLCCARKPEATELEKLRLALCRLHHKQDVEFEVRTDPALLGGFTLEIEGVRYDKSVRGALAGLARQLEERRMA